MNKAENITRQEFFKRSGQILLALVLAGLGIILGFRKSDILVPTDSCMLKSPCTSCGQFRACGDPKAVAAKTGSGENKDGRERKKYNE